MDEKHATPWPPPSAELLAAASSPANRTRRLFRLIDEPFDPPPEVQARSREFMASVRWTYAKTMAFAPHEYCVRAKLSRSSRDAYDRLWFDVKANGYRGRFGSIPHWYMSVDGWRLWSCEIVDCGPKRMDGRPPCPHSRFEVGCVLNRALIDEPPSAQLSLEQDR